MAAYVRIPDKAILYIYGGVSNNWRTQRSMAVNYAVASGVETWYPVYPSCTEAPLTEAVGYLVDVYCRMTERFAPEKIVLSGVSMGGYYALQIVNHICVETDDLCIICGRVHGVLRFDVNDLFDLDLEDGFQQRPAQLFLPHDRAEHEVIHDREFFDWLGKIDIPPVTSP